jgi:hypothetical protein
MDAIHPDACGPGDCGDVGGIDDPISTPRWWVVVWLIWGLVVGGIVLWLDHNQIAAALWVLVGIVTGTWALKALRPFSSPAFQWVHNFASDPDRERRIVELVMEEKTDTEEFKRLSDSAACDALLIAPLMCGFVHGALLGGIGGALSSLDPALNLTASQGALYGIFLSIVGVSFVATIVFAVMMPADKTKPIASRLVQRARMLMAPLLLFPVAWYCLKWVIKRRPAKSA